MSPWENGLANSIGFCHSTDLVTAPNGRPFNQISLPDLVAEPSQGDTFKMERKCLICISGTPCGGTDGVAPRAAALQPMDSLQHHQIGEFPIAKTRNCTPTSPDTGFASIQCRKNIHIRFQAGFVAPLAELLSNAGATMYEMYATRVKPENAVVTLVARGPIA
jgi:hypothetical protein